MGFTIVSISISLVAVFIPIFFMPGVIGLLFHEFAVVVGAGGAGVGGGVADAGADAGVAPAARRTATTTREEKSFIGRHFERGFTGVRNGYERTLDWR